MKIALYTIILMTPIIGSCKTVSADTEESELTALADWLLATPKIKEFPPPPVTSWKPTGVKNFSKINSTNSDATAFRTMHSDSRNSDEISIAYAPMFEQGWVAEENMYIPEGPSFDNQGHVYFVPINPREEVTLVSLDKDTGKRRWAIEERKIGSGGAPLILDNPDKKGENIIYFGSYEYITAVDTNGKVIWDQATGLKASDDQGTQTLHNFGVNYIPQLEALVSITGDGTLAFHDRATGKPLISPPFKINGAPAARSDTAPQIPGFLKGRANEQIENMFHPDSRCDQHLDCLIDAVFGGGTLISNYFTVDPNSGRMWLASTAPDEADGTKDGVATYGALYALDLTKVGSSYEVKEHCSIYFDGGSASTPALRGDGKRIYVGDSFRKMIAFNDSCQKVWDVDMGTQLVASIALSSENGELYGATAKSIIKVVDHGSKGSIAWEADLGIFELSNPRRQIHGNLNLAGIGANGVVAHVGAGIEYNGQILPGVVGLVLLDRETGKVRYGAQGREEGIATMSSNRDGAIYLAHSPMRRAIAYALKPSLDKIIGGIGQYKPIRLDLLARDAACSAQVRVDNLKDNWSRQTSNSKAASWRQIRDLITQANENARKANGDGSNSFTSKQTKMTKLLNVTPGDSASITELTTLSDTLKLACDVF